MIVPPDPGGNGTQRARVTEIAQTQIVQSRRCRQTGLLGRILLGLLLLLLAIPMCLLYEMGIWAARIFIKHTQAPDAETTPSA